MRRTIALAAAVVLAVAVSLPAAASHSWGSYHWARTSNPFTLKLGDNVNSTWDGHLTAASGDWSASSVLDTNVVAGAGANRRKCPWTSGRVEVCNYAYGPNGWLGLASIYASGSHITQGQVKVNDTYFNTSTYNTPAWRQFVMCQEIGHTFGLGHTDETFDNPNQGTCMDYTNDPDGGAGGASPNDPSNERPNSHDFAQLGSIYEHLDSTTTISAVAPSGPGKGSVSRHVFRGVNGATRIVWVLWAGSPRALTAADLD